MAGEALGVAATEEKGVGFGRGLWLGDEREEEEVWVVLLPSREPGGIGFSVDRDP